MKKEELVSIINELADKIRDQQLLHQEACIFCDGSVFAHKDDCAWETRLMDEIAEAQGDA